MVRLGHDSKGRFTSSNPYGGYNEVNPGGRPELYNEEWIEGELKAFAEWLKNPKNIWPNRFSAERGYPLRCLRDAVKKYPRFSQAYEMLNDLLYGNWVECAAFKRMSEKMATAFLTQWKVLDNTPTTVLVKRDDPISLAVDDAMDNSKDLVNERARDRSQSAEQS